MAALAYLLLTPPHCEADSSMSDWERGAGWQRGAFSYILEIKLFRLTRKICNFGNTLFSLIVCNTQHATPWSLTRIVDCFEYLITFVFQTLELKYIFMHPECDMPNVNIIRQVRIRKLTFSFLLRMPVVFWSGMEHPTTYSKALPKSRKPIQNSGLFGSM